MAPSSATLTPERQLLICCARVEMPARLAEKIHQLVAGPLDWDFFLQVADKNALVPLVARHLRTLTLLAPATVLEKLQSSARASAGRSLALTAELFKLLSLFRAASVLAIPYKGPVIAAQAYGDLSLRQFEDVDVIIRQCDAAKAHDIMSGLGYRLRPEGAPSPLATPSIPGEYSYQDGARQIIVELHTEHTLRHFPVAPDLNALAQRFVSVRLSNREVKTFAPEEGLTFLAVHGSKDFWERLSWVADIAELVRSQPSLDWDLAYRFAESLRAERMLNWSLGLAASLLDAQLPREAASRLQKDRDAQSLAAGFAQNFAEAGQHAHTAAARFHVRRRLVAGPLRGWQYAIRLALAPAQDDFAATQLPRPLTPLYAILRPFRLFRKYSHD